MFTIWFRDYHHNRHQPPCSSLSNGGVEHGPFELSVPSIPQNPINILPEVGVEDLIDQALCQAFPAHPHNKVCQVCLASFPATLSNLPTADDQLKAQVGSSPVCCRSDHMITKFIINMRPRVYWCHVLWRTSLCSNMVVVMGKMLFAKNSNNRPPLRSYRPFLPKTPLQVSLSLSIKHWSLPAGRRSQWIQQATLSNLGTLNCHWMHKCS